MPIRSVKHPAAKPRRGEGTTQLRAGSGNVFADLGFKNPELEQAKADLVIILDSRIKELDLSQVEAGKRIGLAQPKLSTLLRGHWQSYSLDRLTAFLNRLGISVEIRTRVAGKQGAARLSVVSG